jgi:hypothetical protein
MDKLSPLEYEKLVDILNEHCRHLAMSIDEKAADIIESINYEAKLKNTDINKAKINLIDTPNGPEIKVTFE